jgi:hypothetical protein
MSQDSNLCRIIFWTVKKKNLQDYVCSLAASTRADVIVLNENQTAIDDMLHALQQKVSADFYVPVSTSKRRFHCFNRTRVLDMTEVHSGFRTSVRNFRIGPHRILLAMIHGVDIRNYDAETRQSFAQELSSEIRFVIEQCYLRLKMDPPEHFFKPRTKLLVSRD